MRVAPAAMMGLATAASGIAAAPPVAVLEMPVVVEPGSDAVAINNVGTLGGITDAGSTLMPLVVDAWGNARILPIYPGATDGKVIAINDLGEAVGECFFCPYLGGDMFWTRDGEVVRAPAINGVDAVYFTDVNNAGIVAGSWVHPDGYSQPLLWDSSTGLYTELPDLEPDLPTSASVGAVNDLGVAVGGSGRNGVSTRWAVVWENGHIRELPAAPYEHTEVARDINDHGVIVGIVFGAKSSGRSIGVWTPGAEEVIALPDRWDNGDSRPLAMNNNGVIIGTSRWWLSEKGSNYYVWYSWYEQPWLTMGLFPPRHNWFDIAIWDINDANQIAGSGMKYGELVGFVITPVTYSFRIRQAFPGRAGEVNTIQIEGAPADTLIHLVAGTIGGGLYIPGCSSQQNALQIDNPQLVQSVLTDSTGQAIVRGRLPETFANQTLLFQAVIPGECAISNLVEQTFE